MSNKNISKGASQTYHTYGMYETIDNCLYYFELQFKFYDDLIFTPNGTDVGLPNSIDETKYYTIKYINDFIDVIKNDMVSRSQVDYPNAQLISSPTTSYNCHSYAWYCQNVSLNDIWISYPYAYYLETDKSYEIINNPRVGDIICYFDDNDTPNDFSDDENLHSGIIVGYSGESSNNVCGNSNMYVVESKWGMEGLYNHKGDECPYTNYNENNGVKKADYVKYYCPRTNATYTLSNSSPTINESLTVPTNHQITDEYEMYELNVNSSTDYEIEVSSNNALDVRLYDEHMQLITIDDLDESANRELFIKPLTNNKRYYLRVSYDDSSQIGTITTSITRHTQHSYNDHYVWTSLTNHKSYCNCGNYINSGHVVSSSAYQSGLLTAPCLLCGGRANIAQIAHQGIGDNYYTPNGSFILPNGVIVLVDEDIEAYLNGTLVFINGGLMLNSNNVVFYNAKKESYYVYD